MKKNLISIVTALTILILPQLIFGQRNPTRPELKTLQNYVFFTTSGAVGNTERSIITGDIGSNVGAITGLKNFDGSIRNVTPATGQASADLVTVIAGLDSLTVDSIHAPLLGGNETLTRGVYRLAEATSLAGNLILDGQGDENAKFIFQVKGALNTTPLSAVVLTNGALACNIFWRAEDVVNLGIGSTMKGTVVTAGGAVTMGAGARLEGRALVLIGAINVTQVFAAVPLGCSAPHLVGPSVPNLLSTRNFGLFTSSGALSDGGKSKITGDVGSNTDNPSGFVADSVSGTIHLLPDVQTAQAATDLNFVYNELNGRIPGVELLAPADLGHGLILSPNTFLLNAATVLTDTLFLDAQGDSTARFILQVTGAFSTTVGAKVILINGAKARNVYWKIDGAVDVGVNARMAGTMVVAAGAIKLGTGTVLDGRGLTMVGAVSTDASTTTMRPDGTLPVTWVSFTGKPAGEKVLLEWVTANELNNGFFTLQKSRDGRSFETFATVPAHGEQKNSQYHYNFTDLLPYSRGYYKISQTDNDGQKSTYKTIEVKVNINESFKAIYYVQQGAVYVKASGAVPANGLMKVYSLDGKLMSSQSILLTKDVSTYKTDKQLPKGIYLVQIESQGTRLFYKKVMVY